MSDSSQHETVWIAESGDYEQRGIDLVGRTLEDAVAAVKSVYCAPYKVTWGPLEIQNDDEATLTGEFKQVINYSTEHTHIVTFTRYVVHVQSEIKSGGE